MNGDTGEPAVASRVISRVATVASGIVLTAAGVYVVVYLARWEWNRAIVAATVFIAMLQVVSTAVIASRLRELSSRSSVVVVRSSDGDDRDDLDGLTVGDGEAGGATSLDDSVLAALQAAGEQRARRHFEWLRADSGRLGVFVPVLLGTGMILSALAWLVERVAGLVAGHSVDRATAHSAPLHMPLAAGRARSGEGLARPPASPSTSAVSHRRRTTAFLAAVLLAVAGIGVESVRRITQSVPETDTGGQTVLEIAVRTRRERPPAEVAVALWTVCRERLDGLPHAVVLATDSDRVTLRIDTALQQTARRRVIGCIEDFTIDGVLGSVVRLDASTST